jgi:DNA-binding HxlR family transcriptional regulator
MDELLRTLMGPWTPYLIWLLETEGPLRFGELKTRTGTISSKVLTERLRHLEARKLVTRTYQPTIPPTVTYALTPRGHELKSVLDGFAKIATRWRAEDQAVAEAPEGREPCVSSR